MSPARTLWLLTAALACIVLPACGTSDDSKPNSAQGGGSSKSFPSDDSAQGIQKFLIGDPYKSAPWQAETTTPREPGAVSPHGRVIVYYNDVLSASHAAGNGEQVPHTTGSMAIKEFYDGDSVAGRAAMLKIDGEKRSWVYWCLGPNARCGVTSASEPEPYYGPRSSACGTCHGGNVYSLTD